MKHLTIDELLIKNGITHLTGKEHDGIIVAFNQYQTQAKLSSEDKQHLLWMYNRLANVHDENHNVDYMSKMKQIIDNL
jgi:hypothetical protein